MQLTVYIEKDEGVEKGVKLIEADVEVKTYADGTINDILIDAVRIEGEEAFKHEWPKGLEDTIEEKTIERYWEEYDPDKSEEVDSL